MDKNVKESGILYGSAFILASCLKLELSYVIGTILGIFNNIDSSKMGCSSFVCSLN